MAKKKEIESKGVVILAFGKRGYSFAAWNLAKSIKHYSPNLHITLFSQDECIKYLDDLTVFDNVEILDQELCVTDSKLDPAKTKVLMYDFLPYTHNIYIDADCILLKDIEPLMDECVNSGKYYLTTVIDKGTKDQDIRYNGWASSDDIWKHFKVKEGAILPAIQSSWCYLKKCKEADVFASNLKKYFDFPIKLLKQKWGGGLPDELIYSGTCANMQLIPEGNDAVFFGNTRESLTFNEIIEKHYILTLYGSGSGRATVRLKYREWYDNLMKKINGKVKYKGLYILQDKHVDNK